MNVGSLIVELGIDDKKTKSELTAINSQLSAFQSKVNSLSLDKLSSMSSSIDKNLLKTQTQITNTTQKIAQLQAQLQTTKGMKDQDLINTNTATIDLLRAKLVNLGADEDMLIAKSIILGQAIEGIGDNKGPDELKDKLDEVSNKMDEVAERGEKSNARNFKSLKMFSLGLMGVRSTMSLLTSSVNTYIQSNDALNARLEGAKQALAQALAPAIEIVVNAFVKLVGWLIVALNYLFTFLNVIFGLNLRLIETSKNLKNIGSNAKSAKKQLSALAGFDDLNILPSEDSSGGGGVVAPDFSGLSMIEDSMAGLNKFKKWLEDNKDLIKIVTIAIAGLAVAFFLLSSPIVLILAVLALFAYLIYQIVQAWDTMTPAQQFLSVLLIALVAIVAIMVIFNATCLANPLTWIILGIILAIGLVVAGILWLKDNWEMVTDAIKGFIQKVVDFFAPAFEVIKNVVVAVFNFILGIIEAWWNYIKAIIGFIVDLFMVGFNLIKDFIMLVINTIIGYFQLLWNIIKTIVEAVKNIFMTIFNGIKDFISKILKGDIAGAFESLKNTIINVFKIVWDTVKNIFGKIWDFIKGIASGIADTFSGAIKGVVNSIITFAEKVINGFIKAINLAIKIINAIPGVNIKTIQELNIPRLAGGGVLTSERLVIGGEYPGARSNPEIVTPQDIMRDTMDDALDARDTQPTYAGPQSLDVTIEIGGRQAGRAIIDLINGTQEDAGRTLLKV